MGGTQAVEFLEGLGLATLPLTCCVILERLLDHSLLKSPVCGPR